MRVSGVLSRIVNGKFCINVSHKTRIVIVTVVGIFSYLALAVSTENSIKPEFFWVAIFGCILMGIV